jgi:hypothetical protein
MNLFHTMVALQQFAKPVHEQVKAGPLNPETDPCARDAREAGRKRPAALSKFGHRIQDLDGARYSCIHRVDLLPK